MKRIVPLLIILLVFAVRCGTFTTIVPETRGRSSLSFSVGGPVAEVSGMDIPLPYMVLRYSRAMHNRVTVDGAFHPMVTVFGGAGIDAGATWFVLTQKGKVPNIGLGGRFYLFYHPDEPIEFFPELSAIVSYRLSRVFTTYLGIQSIFQYEEPYSVSAISAGTKINLGQRLSLTFEPRWYAPNERSDPRIVEYKISPGKQGAIGFLLGVNFCLSKGTSND